jgi:hypothetical protein
LTQSALFLHERAQVVQIVVDAPQITVIVVQLLAFHPVQVAAPLTASVTPSRSTLQLRVTYKREKVENAASFLHNKLAEFISVSSDQQQTFFFNTRMAAHESKSST